MSENENLVRPKRTRKRSTTGDYTLMRLPEDEGLFAVVRKTHEHEQYTLTPTEKEKALGQKIPVYDRVIYLISPFLNHLDGTEEPSCNCQHWMTQKTRCIHLKKFFELNPHLDPGEKTPEEKPEQKQNQ